MRMNYLAIIHNKLRTQLITTYLNVPLKVSIMLNKNMWNPWHLFNENCIKDKYGIIILNTPINIPCVNLLLNIWNNATLRVTTDGGTNQWLCWLKNHNIKSCKNPDLITGDMDSVTEENLIYFQNRCVQIVNTPDQDETDFTKALKELKRHVDETNLEINSVLVLVDTCGRLDQIFANINTLYKASSIWSNVRIYLLATDSLTWLLNSGKHQITIPECIRQNQEWCSIIPVGAKCLLTTSGLKWNLNNNYLEFGRLVSTSNTYDGEENVCIETNGNVIWSMGVNSLFL